MPKRLKQAIKITKARFVNGQELRTWTGFSDHHHRELAKTGLFPEPINGKYDLKKTIVGVIEYLRKSKKEVSDLDKARTRRETAEAEMAEDRRRKLEPTMIQTEVAEAVWVNIGTAVKRVILLSKLSDAEKDAILAELNSLSRADYEDQMALVGQIEAE